MFQQVYRLKNANVCYRLLRSTRLLHSDPSALNVTNKAVHKLNQIAQNGEFLRITVEGGGCAGFEYKLKLDKEKQPDDVIIEKDGANVIVDEVKHLTVVKNLCFRSHSTFFAAQQLITRKT